MSKINKYKNKKCIYNGIKFDSLKEGDYYIYLLSRLKKGEIKDLVLQPKFLLQESFKKSGKTYRKIEYIADFSYFDIADDKIYVIDVKGVKTDVFKMKQKMFEHKYKELALTII